MLSLILIITITNISNVNALLKPPLWEEPTINVVEEGYESDDYLWERVGTAAYAPYGRAGAATIHFVAYLVDKAYREETIDCGIGCTEYYYYYPQRADAWNDFYIWVKWADRDMTSDDINQIQLEGWIMDIEDVSTNPVKITISVTVGGKIVGGEISIEILDIKGFTSDPINYKIENGWLFINHAKNWKSSIWPWRWDDEYYTRVMTLLIWDNDYMAQNNGKHLQFKLKVVPWWYVVHQTCVWGSCYGETYYWGLICPHVLGDNRNAQHGIDGTIIVAPGSETIKK